MNENTLITLESGSEDESLNLLKDFNVKVWLYLLVYTWAPQVRILQSDRTKSVSPWGVLAPGRKVAGVKVRW